MYILDFGKNIDFKTNNVGTHKQNPVPMSICITKVTFTCEDTVYYFKW
jgi:hypothetical protein